MSWFISEILKPFKKPRSRVLSGLKTRLRLEFLNLIIHSGSFFKQNIKTVQLILWMKLSPETTYLCRDIINSKRQKTGENLVTWYKLAFHFVIKFKAAVKKMC